MLPQVPGMGQRLCIQAQQKPVKFGFQLRVAAGFRRIQFDNKGVTDGIQAVVGQKAEEEGGIRLPGRFPEPGAEVFEQLPAGDAVIPGGQDSQPVPAEHAVVEQRVRAVKPRVIEPGMGIDSGLNLHGKGGQSLPPETVMGIGSGHRITSHKG